MIAPQQTKLTYKKSVIRLLDQPQTVDIYWESTLDGSVGHLQVPKTIWSDGELLRLVMDNIDRCYKQHTRMQKQRQHL